MKLKTIIAAVLFSVIVSTAASAQAPAYRNQGYKGSVGLSTFYLFPGIETAHGYMINSNHFIGGGLSLYLGGSAYLMRGSAYLIKEFVQYQWYFLDRNNTPLLTAQLGLTETDEGAFFPYVEPRFGWSWGIVDRFGITVSGGIGLYGGEAIFPSINLAFEF